MDFDKKCKWYKSCGADFCHGEGICPEFEYKQAKPIPKPTHKKHKPEPVRCEKCAYCRSTKVIKKFIHYSEL